MKNGHAHIVRARRHARGVEPRVVYGRRTRNRASLNSKKERGCCIGLLRRRAVCDTDDEDRRDEDEMGTFFDARTRDAHFRSKRTHERTVHPTTKSPRLSTECLPRARLARLFSSLRGSSVRRQSKYTHGRPAQRRLLKRGKRNAPHRVPVVNASRERNSVCDIDL